MQPYHLHSHNCWTDNQLQEATLHIIEGIITEVIKGPFTASNSPLIDIGDAILMPGVIDAHVHINEPGRTHWEGFETATKAAAFGGITTLVDMPLNSSPVVTNVAAMQQKLTASEGKRHVHCGFYGGIVGNEIVEKGIKELEALLAAGCLGVKAFLVHSGIDEFPNATLAALDKAMPVIKAAGVPLLVHCEWEMPIKGEDLLSQNPASYPAYLASRPKTWENEAIKRVLQLCQKHHCPTHIVHLSAADALPLILEAKRAGLPVTVETCTHYLFFEAETIPDGSTLHKCAPPIRKHPNNLLLKNALRDGQIDFIASDHSPAPPDIKELETGNFQKAWGGIAGLQFLLPASWTALRDHMSLSQFIPLLTKHPADFLGLGEIKGKIAAGYHADLVVWDPAQAFEVTEGLIHHRHKASPFVGQTLSGMVTDTFVRGERVVGNGKWRQRNCGEIILKE